MPHDIAIPLPEQRPTRGGASPLPKIDPASEGFTPVRSLYVHIPFCAHKCHYCDFYSIVDRQDRQEAFTTRLERELAAVAPWATEPLDTIFVGGGTPTLLATNLWRRLLRTLDERFDLSHINAGVGEFSVECNPETATRELFDTLVAGGVNRISMGAQSFDPRHLKTLERWHDPQNVGRAAELARTAGINRLSVDLIFAIPGQTLDEWREDMDRALALGTEHLSCYALTYEPGTAMTARLERGEFERADHDLEADMYELCVSHLRAHGLARYEVSNYARPGAECRHNLAYWRQEAWLACGPSASAHVAGWRWKNTPRLDDYLSGKSDFSPVVDVESPDPRRALAEALMTGVRLAEGVPIETTLARARAIDPAIAERLGEIAGAWRGQGRLVESGGRWVLTDLGVLVADRIASDFIAGVA
ncbi:MAG: radical SAM family heme chaperone HemW [Phycisphaerales bacterium]